MLNAGITIQKLVHFPLIFHWFRRENAYMTANNPGTNIKPVPCSTTGTTSRKHVGCIPYCMVKKVRIHFTSGVQWFSVTKMDAYFFYHTVP